MIYIKIYINMHHIIIHTWSCTFIHSSILFYILIDISTVTGSHGNPHPGKGEVNSPSRKNAGKLWERFHGIYWGFHGDLRGFFMGCKL